MLIAAANLMIAIWVLTPGALPGPAPNSRGVARTAIVAANPEHQRPLCRLIAMLASSTGKKDGRERKSRGAVHMQTVGVPLRPAVLLIAKLAIRIGKPAGHQARNVGAVPMNA